MTSASGASNPGPLRWLHPEAVVALLGIVAAIIGLVAALVAAGWIDPDDLPWWPWPERTGVLYMANWSSGTDGWTVPAGWSVANGALVTFNAEGASGTCPDYPILAPWDAGTIRDYAVETRLSVSRPFWDFESAPTYLAGVIVRSGYDLLIGMVDPGNGTGLQPGLQLRVTDQGGGSRVLQTMSPAAVEGVTNTYRIEVRGDELLVWVNDQPTMRVTDATYHSGGKVGIACTDADLTVESFQVLAI
jgi:hypothetical protein